MSGYGRGVSDATIRIAAAGDIHCDEQSRPRLERAFAELEGDADMVLLAGDLTMHGRPEEATALAEIARRLEVPIFAVLGNHDCHAGCDRDVVAILQEAGVQVLERGHAACEASGVSVGIVGCKGFVGGFPGSHLPDFGEPLLRQVYAETTAEVEALDRGLREVALCSVRVVLLHYAPIATTLEGEPPGIWAFLGSDRLSSPIVEHEPDLVLHGHAHSGRFEGAIGEVPVFNVSVPVMGRDFWVFELSGAERPTTPIH